MRVIIVAASRCRHREGQSSSFVLAAIFRWVISLEDPFASIFFHHSFWASEKDFEVQRPFEQILRISSKSLFLEAGLPGSQNAIIFCVTPRRTPQLGLKINLNENNKIFEDCVLSTLLISFAKLQKGSKWVPKAFQFEKKCFKRIRRIRGGASKFFSSVTSKRIINPDPSRYFVGFPFTLVPVEGVVGVVVTTLGRSWRRYRQRLLIFGKIFGQTISTTSKAFLLGLCIFVAPIGTTFILGFACEQGHGEPYWISSKSILSEWEIVPQ